MKKTTFILVFLCYSMSSIGQNVQWAARMGGPDPDPNNMDEELVYDVETDGEGNIYTCGQIRSIAFFDSLQVNTYGMADLFVAKYDCAGNLIWVKTAGGDFDESATSLQLDGQGHIYLSGYIDASSIHLVSFFDTTLGATETIRDMYLAKLDTAGNYLWGKFAGPGNTNLFSIPLDMALNNDGSIAVHVTSYPGELFHGITVEIANKLINFDTSGNVISYFKLSTTGLSGKGSMAVDAQQNYYFTGYWYTDSATFGDSLTFYNPKPGITNSILYVTKFDSIGVVQWVYSFEDTLPGITGSYGTGLFIDSLGNVMVTGAAAPGLKCGNYVFQDKQGWYSVLPFLLKLSPAGQPVWVINGYQQYNGPSNQCNIGQLGNGNYLFSAPYRGQAIYGSDTLYNNAPGIQEMLIAEVNDNGQFVRTVRLSGGGSDEQPQCIATDAQDNIYIRWLF